MVSGNASRRKSKNGAARLPIVACVAIVAIFLTVTSAFFSERLRNQLGIANFYQAQGAAIAGINEIQVASLTEDDDDGGTYEGRTHRGRTEDGVVKVNFCAK